jgi:hypothetical protein
MNPNGRVFRGPAGFINHREMNHADYWRKNKFNPQKR